MTGYHGNSEVGRRPARETAGARLCVRYRHIRTHLLPVDFQSSRCVKPLRIWEYSFGEQRSHCRPRSPLMTGKEPRGEVPIETKDALVEAW